MIFPAGCSWRAEPDGRGAGPAAPAAPGAIRFSDVTEAAGIRFRHISGRAGRFHLPETLGAGCAFLDYNNDGRPDLFFVNSSRLPGFTGQGPFYPALYRNDGGDRFTDVTREAGLAVECYGLGVAVADYDADGDPDLLLSAGDGRSALLRNDGGNAHAWLQVRAIGAGKNRDGIGARVTVTAAGRRQTRWIRSGSSYCSQHERVAFFGLGAATHVDAVEVRFPSGTRQVLKDVKARQRVVVDERKGWVTEERVGA